MTEEELRAYRREWYQKNKEVVKARTRAWAATNRQRKKEADAAYRAANRERLLQQQRNYQKANAKMVAARGMKWRDDNLERQRATESRYRERNRHACNQRISEWKKKNRPKVVIYSLVRGKRVRQAIPGWANHQAMRAIYERAAVMRRGGQEVEVDHIVPLISPVVCGLHWEGNLEIVPATENRRKLNVRWPDMP